MRTMRSWICSSMLTFFLLFVSLLLFSHIAYADDTSVVDDINITVPVSCSLSGTGMDTHITELHNTEYNSAIGETTMKAYCNDSEGFAIYAIGYTDNADGKNVLTNSELGSTYDIATGTQTTGNNSGWAMKLSTVISPEPTYPITIQNNFTSFQEVPDDYTLVAKRGSSTDTGANAEGSTLKSTYQAYISSIQPAGTYTGQVKYVLVHPNYVDSIALKDSVTVVFVIGDSTVGSAKYAKVSKPIFGYVGNNYQEIMTSNILTGGTQNGAYPRDNDPYILQPISINGASGLKVEVTYGWVSGRAAIIQGEWDGSGEPENYEMIEIGSYANGESTTVYVDGDTMTLYGALLGEPKTGYDYGLYVRVYPIYDVEQPETSYEQISNNLESIIPISGTFFGDGYNWYNNDGGWNYCHYGKDVLYYLSNFDAITGSTITLYAGPGTVYCPSG